jgi:hypothetical protein
MVERVMTRSDRRVGWRKIPVSSRLPSCPSAGLGRLGLDTRRGGRVDYCTGLENQSRETDPGFESLPLR